MLSDVPLEIHCHKKICPICKKLWKVIRDLEDKETGYCRISNLELAKALGIKSTELYSYMLRLREIKALTLEYNGGKIRYLKTSVPLPDF